LEAFPAFPAVAGALVLWFTRERFPLTPMVYALILVHCAILMVGGHYTYAEVSVGCAVQWMARATTTAS